MFKLVFEDKEQLLNIDITIYCVKNNLRELNLCIKCSQKLTVQESHPIVLFVREPEHLYFWYWWLDTVM